MRTCFAMICHEEYEEGCTIYKRDGIDLWSTITNFQIIRQAAWPEADHSAEISEENL